MRGDGIRSDIEHHQSWAEPKFRVMGVRDDKRWDTGGGVDPKVGWNQRSGSRGEVGGGRGGREKRRYPGKDLAVTPGRTSVGRNQSSDSRGHGGKGEEGAPRQVGDEIEETPRPLGVVGGVGWDLGRPGGRGDPDVRGEGGGIDSGVT